MQTDCVILGGGAGGLCAAAALGRRGLRVTVVERLPRVGKKLLATGNGRCNLSNLDMQPSHYGKAAPFVERVYAVVPPEEVAAFFASLGLMTAVEDGRVYPRTMAASAVLDVLRMACERHAVSMLTDTEVVALSPSRRRCSLRMVRGFLRRTSSPPWAEAPRRRWARTERARV